MAKLGLALGMGSSRAFAHVGFLKVLEREGIKFDIISGSSSASIIAAMYAAGMNSEQICRRLRKMRRQHLFALYNPLPRVLFPIPPVFSGFVSSKRLEKFIRLFLGNMRFEDLQMPFAPALLDLKTGEEVIFEKGLVYKAVAGSMAIPGAFSPVAYQNKLLVDPGFFEAVPFNFAKRLGADKIIGVMPILERDKYAVLQSLLKNKTMKNKIIFPHEIDADEMNKKRFYVRSKLNYIDAVAYKGNIENIRILEAQFVWNRPDTLFLLPVPNMKPTQFLHFPKAIRAGEYYTSKIINKLKEKILRLKRKK